MSTADEPRADAERRFPIQCEHSGGDKCPRPLSVPWSVAELAYAQYAEWYGRSQSLERLAERQGFGERELVWLLSGVRR